jgi:hypothetical protein
LIATLQRPTADLPTALTAIATATSPFVLFAVFGLKVTFKAPVLWASGTASTAIFLFATSTPVHADFAPLLLVLTVGVTGALTSMLGGLLSTATATALLITASALHRLDAIALYLSFVGMGWVVGFLMHT